MEELQKALLRTATTFLLQNSLNFLKMERITIFLNIFSLEDLCVRRTLEGHGWLAVATVDPSGKHPNLSSTILNELFHSTFLLLNLIFSKEISDFMYKLSSSSLMFRLGSIFALKNLRSLMKCVDTQICIIKSRRRVLELQCSFQKLQACNSILNQ